MGPHDANSLNMDVLNSVPLDAAVVVEVGCGTGMLAQLHRQRNPAVRFYGIEQNPAAAEMAKEHLQDVAIGDLENVALEALNLQLGTVDCLIYSESLERMRDPWATLRRQADWLRDGGQMVACIANVQHWSTLLHFVTGNWRYGQEGGLLKAGQLRFFSPDTMTELFAAAGMQLHDIRPLLLPSTQFQSFRLALSTTLQALKVSEAEFDLRLQAFQYVVRAVKASQPPRPIFIFNCVMEPLTAPVRAWEPERCLNTIPGVRGGSMVKALDLTLPRLDEAKIFVWQRVILTRDQSLAMHKELLRLGYLTVVEFDDDPDHFAACRDHDYLTFTAMHCVQTSSETLAKELRRHNPNVEVFPNQLAALPPPRDYAVDGPVTLFFGALNRQPDWQPLMPALNRVLAAHGNRVRVEVILDREFFNSLETPYKAFNNWCAYERYQEILRGCDIGLLPLNPTKFNSMKSDLKFIECAGHGVAALASPTVYAGTVRPEETALLFETPEEFEQQLHRLIKDQELRLRLARNAYHYVAQARLQVHHYRKRYDWYLAMLAQLPRLNAEIRQRAPEVFT